MKIMPRLANLEAVSQNGPPPEQDIPLAVPKKTKLYVEQTSGRGSRRWTCTRRSRRIC